MVTPQALTVFWFRRDLRLDDNVGLTAALASGAKVLPLFIFDTEILSKLQDRDDSRVGFIHELVQHLDHELRARGGSGLDVRIGKPIEVFRQLVTEFKIGAVYTNHDFEPSAIRRDEEIELFLGEHRIAFHTYKDHVVFEKDEVVKLDRMPYSVFTPYAKKWRETLDPRDLTVAKPDFEALAAFRSKRLPTLEQIGFRAPALPLPKLVPTIDHRLIRSYRETRDIPAIQGTSHLGAHLRFGSVSIRRLVKIAEKESATWLNELIWREFFSQILWHYPHVAKDPFRPEYARIPWRKSPEDFQRWQEGETGYPLVDAGMRELNATGFMHNRVRMVTASFLVKHLLIDYREGESYFARKLFDFDLASNNGNWQWVAGSGCDAAPYFRVFNPSLQLKRFDPQMKYVRQWLPEFGTSKYPQPMVDHQEARERVIKAYKSALSRRGPDVPLRFESPTRK